MIIKNDSQCAALLAFIENNDKLAYDVETTGLNVRNDEIIGFGVSNQTEGFYLAHLAYKNGKLHKLVSTNMCVKVLNALKSKKLITFNGSFDMRFTKNYFGVDLIMSIYSDALLAKHTCDEEQPFRLKDIAKKLYGVEAAEEQRLMKESIKANGGSATEYFKADLDIMGKYCITDCLLTYQVDADYHEEITKEGLEDFYFKDEVMPLYREVVIPMEEKGVFVDVDKLTVLNSEIISDIDNLQDEIQSDLDPLKDEFRKWFLWKDFKPSRTGLFAQAIADYCVETEFWVLPKTETGKYSLTKVNIAKVPSSRFKDFITGELQLLNEHEVELIQLRMFEKTGQKYMFNLSSKHHLKKILFQTLNETPLSKTPTGQPQINDEFLDQMAEKHDWCRKLRIYNKLIKIQGTYIGRYLENQEDGVYYPSWFMHRTTSGRLGGDLMQLPRQLDEDEALDPIVMKYTNAIRDCIVSRNGKLCGADYTSLEVVVFADDAGDESLLNMIRNKHDFYSTVAIDIHGLQDKYSADKNDDNFLKKLDPVLRQNTKPPALGIRYGMKDYKLSYELDCSQREAKVVIAKYFESYPKLKTRMDELITFAKKNGYVKSKAGRVRHLKLLPKLENTYGSILEDGLKLWQKFNEGPKKKYDQMKYLGTQYRGMINNCLNFPIQSMAASITNRASIAMAREFKRVGLNAYICMNIHDEIVVHCEDKDVKRVCKIMQFTMENTTKLSVPLTAEPEVGVKYGDIK